MSITPEKARETLELMRDISLQEAEDFYADGKIDLAEYAKEDATAIEWAVAKLEELGVFPTVAYEYQFAYRLRGSVFISDFYLDEEEFLASNERTDVDDVQRIDFAKRERIK